MTPPISDRPSLTSPSAPSSEGASDIDFGFARVPIAEKQGRVAEIFSSVAGSYDIMNDLMSGGVHRLWKAARIDWMAPQPHQTLIDLAGGTGDIGQRFLRAGGGFAHITDINESMLMAGKKRRDLQSLANKMNWCNANAEQLPFADNAADFVTIAFGLRNVTDKALALDSMYRVLKPGGRLLILEFSKPQSEILSKIYDAYSFNVLPKLGKLFANDAHSYQYLAESIRMHPDQKTLLDMMDGAGFASTDFHNMTGGLVALHRGVKP